MQPTKFEHSLWSFEEIQFAVERGRIYLDPPYCGCNDYGLETIKGCMQFWEIGMFPTLFFKQMSTGKWLREHPGCNCPFQPLDVVSDALVRYICACKERMIDTGKLSVLETNRLMDSQIDVYTIPLCEFEKGEMFYRLAVNHHRTALNDFDIS